MQLASEDMETGEWLREVRCIKSIGSQLPENERKLASHDIDRVLMTGRPAFLREPVFQ